MAELQADFELLPRETIEAEMELVPRDEMEATFEINVCKDGKDGKDATINGINTVTMTASDGITLQQEGDTINLSGENLENQITVLAGKVNGYVHEQGVASAVWTVQHNLDKYPSVTVVDSAENEIVAEVEYIDKNTVQIRMIGASKGRAYLS